MLKKITIVLKHKNKVVGTAKITGGLDGKKDDEIVISNADKLYDGTLVVFGTQIAITDFYKHISTYKMPIIANDDIWCAVISGDKIAVGGTGKVPTESEIKRMLKDAENKQNISAENDKKSSENDRVENGKTDSKTGDETVLNDVKNPPLRNNENGREFRAEKVVETEGKTDVKQDGIKPLFDACEFAGDNFYLAVKPQLDELFVCHPEEQNLNATVPNSKWVKVDAAGGYFVVGLVYDGESVAYVCYGVPAKRKTLPPPEIADACVWLPFDKKMGAGVEGYWVVYQDASKGNIL